jgi:TPR repeat protein
MDVKQPQGPSIFSSPIIKCMDYVPLASTITNLAQIVNKILQKPTEKPTTEDITEHTVSVLSRKSEGYWRNILLCIPLVGNIIIGGRDLGKLVIKLFQGPMARAPYVKEDDVTPPDETDTRIHPEDQPSSIDPSINDERLRSLLTRAETKQDAFDTIINLCTSLREKEGLLSEGEINILKKIIESNNVKLAHPAANTFVEKESGKAFTYFNSHQELPECLFQLAKCYASGTGTTKNIKEAKKTYDAFVKLWSETHYNLDTRYQDPTITESEEKPYAYAKKTPPPPGATIATVIETPLENQPAIVQIPTGGDNKEGKPVVDLTVFTRKEDNRFAYDVLRLHLKSASEENENSKRILISLCERIKEKRDTLTDDDINILEMCFNKGNPALQKVAGDILTSKKPSSPSQSAIIYRLFYNNQDSAEGLRQLAKCYSEGIGTTKNKQKSDEFLQKYNDMMKRNAPVKNG